jgi:hypothetical protein
LIKRKRLGVAQVVRSIVLWEREVRGMLRIRSIDVVLPLWVGFGFKNIRILLE